MNAVQGVVICLDTYSKLSGVRKCTNSETRMSDYTETFGGVKRYLKENNGEMQDG